MIPAYLTFVEPVLGPTLIVVIGEQFPTGALTRAPILAVLASIKAVLVATFLFSFFMEGPIPLGMLSCSQFSCSSSP